MSNAVQDFYKFPKEYFKFITNSDVSNKNGFFLLDDDIVCYGQTSLGSDFVVSSLKEGINHLSNIKDIEVKGNEICTPFNLDEILRNYRFEKYCNTPNNQNKSIPKKIIRDSYYTIRPLLPINLRKHLQKFSMRHWKEIKFPKWPVDFSVEKLNEKVLLSYLKKNPKVKIPFIWFWPEGKSACLIMTHDVEEQAGRDFIPDMIKMEVKHGLKSSFQLVPEVRYTVSKNLLNLIKDNGCEFNLHGLNHDGKLFNSKDIFLSRVKKINNYAKEWGALGFRSPIMYRNLDWYHHLDFKYDMSVPNIANIDPQKGGCCSVFPYFVGDILEIPTTTIQDHPLYFYFNDFTIDLWKVQTNLILKRNGLISFIIHPDYTLTIKAKNNYDRLLSFIKETSTEENIWTPIPKEVQEWWSQRDKMSLSYENDEWVIKGEGNERAQIAYITMNEDKIKYEFNIKPVPESKEHLPNYHIV